MRRMILPAVFFGAASATAQAIGGVIIKEPLSLTQFAFHAIVLSFAALIFQAYYGRR